ncbi:MAG: endonuclease [Bacteroidia bacterium]|nr:endonuclease [Bacteroidia bacterium]
MKKFSFLASLLIVQLCVLAQTNLPTSWNFSNPGISTPPSGWTMNLGTNGNLTYAFGVSGSASVNGDLSCRLDLPGENFIIHYSGKSGPLSYYLSPQNAGNAWSGQFEIQESSNGLTWSSMRIITYKSSTTTSPSGFTRYVDFPNDGSRFIRFLFAQKISGNMGVDSVMILAPPAAPEANLAVLRGASSLVNGAQTIIGNSASTVFSMQNKGSVQTLTIDSIVFTGDAASDYSVTGLPLSVNANSSSNVTLQFSASTNGSRKAMMKIYSNDSLKNPFVLDLYGIGGNVATEPSGYVNSLTFSDVKSYGYTVNAAYTGQKPERFIILKKLGSAVSESPIDGITYKKGDFIGSAQIEYVSDTLMSYRPTYVLANKTYHYACFTFNGPAGFENYRTTNVQLGSVTTSGRTPGSYYAGINPRESNFVTSLSARINPHDTIYYSNYISRMVNPWLTRDTTNGKKVVTCVYTNHQFLYDEPFLWAAGNNGAVLTREHTWPQSWMPSNMGNPDWPNAPGTSKELPEFNDLHNLFPAHQANANSRRSNNPFDEVVTATYTAPTGFGVLGRDSANRTAYEPRPEQKGDIARALFYMATCYHGINGLNWSIPSQQNLDLLKQWHQMDPPDDLEIARNEFVAQTQGNRNPFIDFPEWVNRINFRNMSYVPDSTPTQPQITVTSPLSSDTWGIGKRLLISWMSQDIDSVEVFISLDSMQTWFSGGTHLASKDSFSVMAVSPFTNPFGIVRVKDKNSNVSDTSDYFMLDMTNSLKELEALKKLQVYPNPFSQNLIIKWLEPNGKVEAKLFNVMGAQIKSFELTESIEVKMDDVPAGIYFLQLRNASNQVTQKLIKH